MTGLPPMSEHAPTRAALAGLIEKHRTPVYGGFGCE